LNVDAVTARLFNTCAQACATEHDRQSLVASRYEMLNFAFFDPRALAFYQEEEGFEGS